MADIGQVNELPYKRNKNGDYVLFKASPNRQKNVLASNKRKYQQGYVYFIKIDGYNIYKIGVSHKPDRRLRDIHSYIPFDFKILSLHKFQDPYKIEGEIISTLKEFQMKGEWFSLTIEKAKEIMTYLHNIETYVSPVE
jgi:hypothetical protein